VLGWCLALVMQSPVSAPQGWRVEGVGLLAHDPSGNIISGAAGKKRFAAGIQQRDVGSPSVFS
jgi:hypothetical protein